MLKTFGHLQKNDYLCIIKNKNNNLKIRAMNVYTESDRYTVLLHAFDTFEGACEYITQIINVGECKVLPLIKAWNGGIVVAKWMAKKTEDVVKFELLLDGSKNK